MNSVLKTIKERRSIRNYTEEKVSEEDLNIILEAGTFAPVPKTDNLGTLRPFII